MNSTHPFRSVPSNLACEVEDVVVGFLACWRLKYGCNGRYVECGCRSDRVGTVDEVEMNVKRRRTGDGKVGLAVLDVGLLEDLWEDGTEITTTVQSERLGGVPRNKLGRLTSSGAQQSTCLQCGGSRGIGACGQSQSTAILSRRNGEERDEERCSPLQAAHHRQAEQGEQQGCASRC